MASAWIVRSRCSAAASSAAASESRLSSPRATRTGFFSSAARARFLSTAVSTPERCSCAVGPGIPAPIRPLMIGQSLATRSMAARPDQRI